MYMWFSFGITVLKLISSIHFNYQIFHPKKSSTCNYHPKSSLMFKCHPNVSSIMWLSTMYMWRNIFHIICTWHKDITKIFCPRHQNILNIFIFVHMLKFTLMCSLHNVVEGTKTPNYAPRLNKEQKHIAIHWSQARNKNTSWCTYANPKKET
jgi:hypothetical protein